jgi:hypothetical protein
MNDILNATLQDLQSHQYILHLYTAEFLAN